MNEINLRNEANYLIDNYGIDVLYVRNSKYMKCKCYDELYKLGNYKCNICFGSGKITSIEKMKCFYNNDKYYSKSTIAGKYNVDIGKFIFKYNSEIEFNDVILVVGYKDGKVKDVKQVYKVNNSNEIRCDKGRIEYYEVDVITDNTLVKRFDSYIKNNDVSKKMIIGRW